MCGDARSCVELDGNVWRCKELRGVVRSCVYGKLTLHVWKTSRITVCNEVSYHLSSSCHSCVHTTQHKTDEVHTIQ